MAGLVYSDIDLRGAFQYNKRKKEKTVMEVKEKLALLADVLEVEDELTPEMVLSEIDEYNSMAKLSLIVMMSDEFSKKLTNEEIKSFVTVQDILNYME